MSVKIANPAMKFNYLIELNGFDMAKVQGCEIGNVSIEKTTYGAGHKNIKRPGKITIPDITIERMAATDIPDNYFWEWLKSARNPKTGRGNRSRVYLRDFNVHLLAEDEVQRVASWACVNGWAFDIKWDKLGDNEEGTFIETCQISIDDIDKFL